MRACAAPRLRSDVISRTTLPIAAVVSWGQFEKMPAGSQQQHGGQPEAVRSQAHSESVKSLHTACSHCAAQQRILQAGVCARGSGFGGLLNAPQALHMRCSCSQLQTQLAPAASHPLLGLVWGRAAHPRNGHLHCACLAARCGRWPSSPAPAPASALYAIDPSFHTVLPLWPL